MALIQLRDCVFVVKDSAGSATIKIGTGNATFSVKRTIEYVPDRGNLDEVRRGDDMPMELSFQFNFSSVTATGTPSTTGGAGTGASSPTETVIDYLSNTSGSRTSVDTDPCKPYACDIEMTVTPPCAGGGRKYTFPDFRVEDLSFDVKASQVSASGKCNATTYTLTSV